MTVINSTSNHHPGYCRDTASPTPVGRSRDSNLHLPLRSTSSAADLPGAFDPKLPRSDTTACLPPRGSRWATTTTIPTAARFEPPGRPPSPQPYRKVKVLKEPVSSDRSKLLSVRSYKMHLEPILYLIKIPTDKHRKVDYLTDRQLH